MRLKKTPKHRLLRTQFVRSGNGSGSSGGKGQHADVKTINRESEIAYMTIEPDANRTAFP